MLDAYTSTMCLRSKGRNTYARALIEILSQIALVDSLIMVIPFQNGSGHSMENINIEYEWQPLDVKCVRSLIIMMIIVRRRLRLLSLLMLWMMGLWSKPTSRNNEASTSQSKEAKESSKPHTTHIGTNNNVFANSKLDDSDSEEVENIFVEDNGKHIDGLVDDAQKKVEVPLKKIHKKNGIWLGRKTDSPIRNVTFSFETKVHYFDRDDIEEVERENAY
nr:zinc knuckle CX2CX4HX4C [Tanacetum cinerariifolium]